jgi:hypothetical protein
MSFMEASLNIPREEALLSLLIGENGVNRRDGDEIFWLRGQRREPLQKFDAGIQRRGVRNG